MRSRAAAVDATLVHLAAAGLALLGLGCCATLQTHITAETASNERSIAQYDADERLLAERPGFERTRSALRTLVATRLHDAATARDIARFVRDAATLARRHHISITALVATSDTARVPYRFAVTASPVEQPVPPGTDDSPALDITVEGRYADVLSFARILPQQYTLARVDIASLTRKSSDSADESIVAVIRALLPQRASLRATASPAQAIRR